MNRCRSCSAPIIWVVTEKGKRMPLDAEPTADGNIIVSAAGIARVVGEHPALDVPPEATRYRSHYATCPQAGEWRQR